jgi:hypothetical protein
MTKLNSVSVPDHIQALYRLLLIQTGQRTQAEQVLRATLTESLGKTSPDQNRTDFVHLYREVVKLPATASATPGTDLAGWPLALHHLPEPQRSAITLFYLEIFTPGALSEIFDLDIEELARIISTARETLSNLQIKPTIPGSL